MKKLYFSSIVFLAFSLSVQAQTGMGIGTNNPAEKLEVVGAIKLGTTTATNTGTIRWNGTNFQGYDGSQWVNLDESSSGGNTLDAAYDEGGLGSGRQIDASNGAVRINGTDGILVTGSVNVGADAELSGAGTRFFFNPKRSALRAGTVSGSNWDSGNLGLYSVAIGNNALASGNNTVALGNTAVASDNFSVAIGYLATASGNNSYAIGYQTTASGDDAQVFGYNSSAAGQASKSLGFGTHSESAFETVVGRYDTDYTPVGATTWNANDRLFVVGNGTGPSARSNALTIYKNGSININDAYTLPTADGSIGEVLTTNGSGNVSWTSVSGGSDADWTVSGNNQYSAVSGNVGIGTVNPSTKLEVAGQLKITGGAPGLNKVLRSDGTGLASWVDPNTLLSAGIFANTSGVTSNENGTYATDDFVFGSPQLADNGNNANDSRFFFDKSKSAFRAGMVQSTQWDDANVGSNSVAFGSGNTASGSSSASFGTGNTSSGIASLTSGSNNSVAGGNSVGMGFGNTVAGGIAVALGNTNSASAAYAVAIGANNSASGQGAIAIGSSTSATQIYATAMGVSTTASASGATALGSGSTASGSAATALGNGSTASGTASSALGRNTVASGTYSTAFGDETTASGRNAIAGGANLTAESGYEIVLGRYDTDYTPGSTSGWNTSDRLFVLGNGTSNAARSNALTILKDGTMNINDAYSLPNADGSAGQVLTTDGSGAVTWSAPAAGTSLADDDNDTKIQVEESADEDKIRFDTGNSERMIIDENGNIGVGTSSPVNLLHVQNDVSGLNFPVFLRNSSVNAGDGAGIGFLSEPNGNWTKAGIYYERTAGFGVGKLHLLVDNGADNQSVTLSESRLTVKADGNVGIGTTNPQADLEVIGDARVSSLAGTGTRMVVADANGDLGTQAIPSGGGTADEIVDADGDTKIQVEESADEDIIRFDVGGTEHWVMDGARLEALNNGSSVFIGEDAGAADDLIDNRNVFVGYQSGMSNTGGRFNTGLGFGALKNNTSGTNNIALGPYCLFLNTTGGGNVAIGEGNLFNNNGAANTAVGKGALYTNTSGYRNTAIGEGGLRKNTTGYYNATLGIDGLYNNVDGHDNIAIGYRPLYDNTSGAENIGIGYEALADNTTADANIGIGAYAGFRMTTGGDNTGIGRDALSNITVGNRNTALGRGANNQGLNNLTNSTGIGYNAEPNASNTVRLGDASVSTIGGYANWTNVSDGRFKTNVQENVAGLDFILALRPVTYNLDMDAIAKFNNTSENDRYVEGEALKAAEIQSGFIAQEVEEAANAVGYDFHGVDKPKNEISHYGLRYAEFVVPMVKAMQEQQQMIESQNSRIEQLMNVNEELLQRIEALEAE